MTRGAILLAALASATAAAQGLNATADAITGLRPVGGGAAKASRTKVVGDVTPFLGAKNTGRAAWRFEYPKAEPFHRTFVATLDASTGRLLHITATGDSKPDSNVKPMPSSASATKQLKVEGEEYAGYPPANPAIDFATALKRIETSAAAQEIHAVYVLHRRAGTAMAKPVWAITLRGIPPIPARGPAGDSVPVWKRNQMRYVVDATTGEVLFSTNTPTPE